MKGSTRSDRIPAPQTETLPLKVSQRTPSFIQSEPRTRPWLLVLVGVALFVASVGLGWGASRLIWPGVERPPAGEQVEK